MDTTLNNDRLLAMSQQQLDDALQSQSARPDSKRGGERQRHHRPRHDVQRRHRAGDQRFRVARQVFDAAHGIARQSDDTVWSQRDRCRGLRGPELARRKRLHRARLFENVDPGTLDPRRNPAHSPESLSRRRLLGEEAADQLQPGVFGRARDAAIGILRFGAVRPNARRRTCRAAGRDERRARPRRPAQLPLPFGCLRPAALCAGLRSPRQHRRRRGGVRHRADRLSRLSGAARRRGRERRFLSVGAGGSRRRGSCTSSSRAATASRRATTSWRSMRQHSASAAAAYVNWRGRTMLQVREEAAIREAMEAFSIGTPPRSHRRRRSSCTRMLRHFLSDEIAAGRLTMTPEAPTARGSAGSPTPYRRHRADRAAAVTLGAAWRSSEGCFAAAGAPCKRRRDPEICPRVDPAVRAERIAATRRPRRHQRLQRRRNAETRRGAARSSSSSGLADPQLCGAARLYGAGVWRACEPSTSRAGSGSTAEAPSRLHEQLRRQPRKLHGRLHQQGRFGLNFVFSNGIGYPTTRWLLSDGCKDEQKFKNFLHRHQFYTQVWYNAHPGLTAADLERNARIRAGLEASSLSPAQCRAMGGAAMNATNAGSAVEYEDVQGIVRFGYKHLTEARYVLLRIADAQAAREWLGAAPVATSATATTLPETALQVAFTAAGLRALGVPEEVVGAFSRRVRRRHCRPREPFAAARRRWGQRARELGRGAWPVREPHVLVALFAAPGKVDAFAASLRTEPWSGAFTQIACLDTSDLGGVEPFGFTDGISQPVIDWDARQNVARQQAELRQLGRARRVSARICKRVRLLYGTSAGRLRAAQPTCFRRQKKTPAGATSAATARISCFAICARTFEHFGRSRNPTSSPSAFVGRRRNGDPLVPPAAAPIEGIEKAAPGAPQNNFTYAGDPQGVLCPFGAHIRRANPRTGDFPAVPSGPIGYGRRDARLWQERLSRRLDVLGSLSPRPAARPRIRPRLDRRKRLGRRRPATSRLAACAFVCLNANIARQFEFLQNAWISSDSFDGLIGESDPLLGDREPDPRRSRHRRLRRSTAKDAARQRMPDCRDSSR